MKKKNRASAAASGSLLAAIGLFASLSALANKVDIVDVQVTPQGSGSYRFDVTLKHDDEGWDHYASKWQVLSPLGKLLGERVLLHPHVSEQPFTRSLGGVEIPAGLREVDVRAWDTVHGEGETMRVKLPAQ